jgi:hypothetical protein
MDTEKNRALSIARQSQIKIMLEHTSNCGICVDLKTLVAGAEVLADWVVNGYSKEIGNRCDRVQQHLDSFLEEKTDKPK